MSRRVLLDPTAVDDLREQSDYFAESSIDTAARFLRAANETFENLARMPGMGSRQQFHSKRLQGLRRWQVQGFPAHLVFYRTHEEAVEILRVLHGARDIETILEDEPA